MSDLELLRTLCTDKEWTYCREKLRVFDDPQANRNQLAEAANDERIVALEKKYVPELNREQSQQIECDTLISTVGLRPQPVLLTVLCLKPKRVFLLHTEASRPSAEQIRDDPEIASLKLRPNVDVVLKAVSATDAPHNYDVLQHDVLPQTVGRVVMDPTGGVKIMGVSLAAFAFWRRIPMVYLQGKEVKGIVYPFSERLTLVENPYDHFGDPDLALLKELFDRGNYSAALEVCRSLLDTVRDPATESKLRVIEEVITFYRDWDAFIHSHESRDLPERRLGSRLEDLRNNMQRLGFQIIEPSQLEANLSFVQELENRWGPGRNNAEPYRLVDIFMNAKRRAKLGQYDDAVARLYRCLEMSATIHLVERWSIKSPDKPDIKKIAEKVGGQDALREEYQRIRQRELPQTGTPWGLDDQMAFLEIVEPSNQIVAIYKAMRDRGGDRESLMDKRNRSILAHGTIPITEQEYREFESRVAAVIRITVGTKHFQTLQQQATHPKLLLGD